MTPEERAAEIAADRRDFAQREAAREQNRQRALDAVMTPTTERTAAEVAALHARLDRRRQQTAQNGRR
jgi:hypothetical protein